LLGEVHDLGLGHMRTNRIAEHGYDPRLDIGALIFGKIVDQRPEAANLFSYLIVGSTPTLHQMGLAAQNWD